MDEDCLHLEFQTKVLACYVISAGQKEIKIISNSVSLWVVMVYGDSSMLNLKSAVITLNLAHCFSISHNRS
ncbi:hypothetical protein VNO77_00796 [Canavalia gladiata]|uniref:Uncharacterized protein n=1 Tax=Canavalia gladiata TaxID=3824 RepID=A0AAN9MRV8_CANGL